MSEASHTVPVSPDRLRWAKAGALLIMVLSLVHAVTYGVMGLPFDRGLSHLGVNDTVDVAGGYVRVEAPYPGSAAEAAGMRAGDWIRFDRPLDVWRLHVPAGETFGVSIRRDQQTFRLTLTAPASNVRPIRWDTLASAAMHALLALAGGLIAVRSRRVAGVALGVALVSMALLGSYTYLWENHPVIQVGLCLIFGAVLSAAPVALLTFALLMRSETFGRPIARPWKAALWAYASLQGVFFVADAVNILTLEKLPLIDPLIALLFGNGMLAFILPNWGGFALAFVVLGLSFKEARGADRTRFGFLIGSLALLFAGTHGFGFVINMTGNDFSFANPLAIAMQVSTATGVAGFLYSMLRHRVVDLGFAVNRTLIYGMLSTALLFAFFLMDWGVDQLIPAAMRQANMLVGIGVALALFLGFHYARDWVEKAVETLFFRHWWEREREFRRFLRQTGFVNGPDALAFSTTTAMSRFADAAPVALYCLDDGGSYALKAGGVQGLADRLDADMPPLVRMRAEHEPIDEQLPDGVELLLPMTYRNEVSGVIALGPKPDGELIRPDQIALLAEAALKVGLDLHALRVAALETESREQRLRAEVLQDQIERLVRSQSPA